MSGVTQLREWKELEGGEGSSYELDPQILEISTTGIDESTQGFGSDPFGGSSWVGLRVPKLATELLAVPGQSAKNSRYLLMLASFSISEGVKAKILGYRQMVRLGYIQPATDVESSTAYPVTQIVEDPAWKFVDGNVSFHLQGMGPPNAQGISLGQNGPNDLQSFKQGFSMTPAVLYDTATVPGPFYVDLTAYKPPGNGAPWGTPLRSGGQRTVYGQRTDWKTHGAWDSLGFEVEGPETVCLFASVRQTNPLTRTTLTLPGTLIGNGLSVEESFLQNFPNAIYHSVAGALIVRVGG
jgi:hypothetical protein